MKRKTLLLSLLIIPWSVLGFIPQFDNNVNKLYNLPKINKLLFKTKLDISNSNISVKLKKYKPLYKILYKFESLTTIRFRSILVILILLRSIYSVYNNVNDVVSIINLIDEKDIQEINKILDFLNFINIINIFNIITLLELYDLSDHIIFLNKKSIFLKKYLRLYKKDCFIIKYL
jgi:hypothetical protein